MMGIPYRYGIETLSINRNRNVKHKTETETERTLRKKEKKKFETSAFGGASRCVFFTSSLPAFCRWRGCKGLMRKAFLALKANPATAALGNEVARMVADLTSGLLPLNLPVSR